MAMSNTRNAWLRWGHICLVVGIGVIVLMLAACSDLDIGNWPGKPDPLNPANRPSTMSPALQGRMFEPGRVGYAHYDYVK